MTMLDEDTLVLVVETGFGVEELDVSDADNERLEVGGVLVQMLDLVVNVVEDDNNPAVVDGKEGDDTALHLP